MALLVIFLILLALALLAPLIGVDSRPTDPRSRRDWSVGALLAPHHRR